MTMASTSAVPMMMTKTSDATNEVSTGSSAPNSSSGSTRRSTGPPGSSGGSTLSSSLRGPPSSRSSNSRQQKHNHTSQRRRRTTRSQQQYQRGRSDLMEGINRHAAIRGFLIMFVLFCLIDVMYLTRILNSIDSMVVGEGSTTTTANGAAAARSTSHIITTYESSSSTENDTDNNDKGPLLDLLKEAGFHDLDDDTLSRLPSWSKVNELYGMKGPPKIYGLEQCPNFRHFSDPADHFVGVAGAFNSGTNLLAELLIANCHNKDRMSKYGSFNAGIRWQVPWGKHNPPGDYEFRQSHKTAKDKNVDANNILPAVTIRDPFGWMGSMCRHHYTATWPHDEHRHCPNLLPDDQDRSQFRLRLYRKETVPVKVKYVGADIVRYHDSLAHFWNEWYKEYVDADFPRLIVRYEDLVFRPKETITQVCECFGGTLKSRFQYVVDTAKKGENAHGAMNLRTGYLEAIIRYGTDKNRYSGMTKEDLVYAKDKLSRHLMDFFGYRDPPDELMQ